jgi:hypothetical protein
LGVVGFVEKDKVGVRREQLAGPKADNATF